jgi:UDP-N-acetyl-2-amino-2-deoxyglucuronate dehydrogenase
VIKVMRGEAEPETDGREGLKSLEVLIASVSFRARRRASRCRWTTDHGCHHSPKRHR